MSEETHVLRQYQERIVANVYKSFATHQKVLIVAATGTGKTQIFSFIAKEFLQRGRVLVLAHRDELVQQACSRLRTITGIVPTVEKADRWSDEENMHGRPPLVVSSIQTQITGRMNRFHPSEFSLVIADEAHHGVSQSWSTVIDYYMRNPACKLLGVTATPDRADEEMLGEIFQDVADTYSLTEAVDDGYLVPVRPWAIEIEGLDFSKIHTLAGDFNQGELEEAMMFEEPLHGVAHATIEIACGLETGTLRQWLDDPDRAIKLAAMLKLLNRTPKKCLVFCVSVAHAERIREIFCRWLPKSAEVVSGQLSDEHRAERLLAFNEGPIRFLCNCMLCTEGWDSPVVEICVCARPTKSRSLYTQMVGRATRPCEAVAHRLGELATAEERAAMIAASTKPSCEVLDFVGNSGRHELVTVVDIFGTSGGYEDEVIARAKELAADGQTHVQEALEESREELERKRREAEQRRKEMEEKRRRQAMEAGRQGLVAAANYRIQVVNEWDDPPDHISTKHANIFRKAKVPIKDVAGMDDRTRGELCRKIVMHWQLNLCTYRQAKCLRRAGWTQQELERMTFDAASTNITALAANGWRRPR